MGTGRSQPQNKSTGISSAMIMKKMVNNLKKNSSVHWEIHPATGIRKVIENIISSGDRNKRDYVNRDKFEFHI